MKKEPGDRKLLAAARTLRKVIDKHFRGEPMTFEDEQKYLAHAKFLIDAAELLYNPKQNNVIEPQLQQADVMRAEGRTVAFIPTDDYINELWEERNSSGTYLEGNLCRRDGAKFIRDLMLKGNGA